MPFVFIHFIDSFLELMGPERTLAPADIARYFGTSLSKNLIKKLEGRAPAMEYFSPKSWSSALVSCFTYEDHSRFLDCENKTKAFLETSSKYELFEFPASSLHLTWNFFGDCGERFLSELGKKMKDFERKRIRSLDPFKNKELSFSGLDYFSYDKNQRGILYLKPQENCLETLKEVREIIGRELNFSWDPAFKPHLTVARINDLSLFSPETFSGLKSIWTRETFLMKPNHFILIRHLDHIKNQPVFGLKASEGVNLIYNPHEKTLNRAQ